LIRGEKCGGSSLDDEREGGRLRDLLRREVTQRHEEKEEDLSRRTSCRDRKGGSASAPM